MDLRKTTLALLISALIFTTVVLAETNDEKDFAVPAFSDSPLFGVQNTAPQGQYSLNVATQRLSQNMTREQLNPFPTAQQIQWLDINRDLQLNDFDVKQFQSIVENLRGEKLTGLQLAIRFREAQKNQSESFPLNYDLDHDGMFTAYDVDYFTQVVNKLDEGATRGNELILKFRLQIFPQNKK